MTVAGLCSVTFRQLAVEAVVDLAAANGLEAIEWGGDVHLPPGDDGAAERIRSACKDAGIDSPSYGSYLGAKELSDGEAARCLDTAVALGAPNVRAWCRYGAGPDADKATRAAITADVATIAEAADQRALTVSLEFHPSTLTETPDSTLRLLADVGAPNLFTYWQPPPGGDAASYAAVADHVSHLHVFAWDADGTRHPLGHGEALWPAVLAEGTGRWSNQRVAFLEFVRGDDPSQLVADAATLRQWLSGPA